VTGEFVANPPPEKTTQPDAYKDLVIETHEGTVTWTALLEISPGVDAAKLKVEGKITAQACDAGSCFPPEDYAFAAALGPGMETSPAIPAAVVNVAPPVVASQPAVVPAPAGASLLDAEQLKRNIAGEKDSSSLLSNLLLGFAGGLILNLMPCVLPVIGLKIFSFVEQAGQDRKTAFLLNLSYSFGLLAVFWLLAVLAIAPSLALADKGVGWGQQFQSAGFNVFIAALVFTMALSFLGVWEFPIPGLAAGAHATQLAQQEGFGGAFFKGVVTTLLATPCTGPYMGGALAWAFYQPPHVTIAVFTSVGLGMASPYLLIGAFPGLIRFLPKPGAWMETFKQVMGFVLLGTVVYVFSFLETSYLVPTVGLLFALWFACWWRARTSAGAENGEKLRAWLQSASIAGVAWLFLFPGIDAITKQNLGWFPFLGLHEIMADRIQGRLDYEVAMRIAEANRRGSPSTAAAAPSTPAGRGEHLRWQPFTTRAEFEKLLASGKTVLVDFTADWCPTCKALEAKYLNTREVRELVDKNGVATVKADWTDYRPEITTMLELLGAKQVPVVAIFPAGMPNNPTRFVNGYTTARILEALEKAGPSKPALGSATARD
jgi:suppressor for copper-sensitivity B